MAVATKTQVNKKHTIVNTDYFINKYDYNKRRKEWHQKAGHNDVQALCSACNQKDNWITIKLSNGKHICYYCWITKPTEEVKQKVATKKETKALVVAKQSKKTKEKNEIVNTKKIQKKKKLTKAEKKSLRLQRQQEKEQFCKIYITNTKWEDIR